MSALPTNACICASCRLFVCLTPCPLVGAAAPLAFFRLVCPSPYKVAGVIFSVAVLAHSAKNRSACVEGFVTLEGLYCVLQFPLSCAFVAFSQERAARTAGSSMKTT